jgi:hypothetical protein
MRQDYSGPLPTIGHDRGHGVSAIRVYCRGLYCGHSGDIGLDLLALADDLPVIEISRHRRFVCLRCGSRKVSVRSIWPPARGAGAPLD